MPRAPRRTRRRPRWCRRPRPAATSWAGAVTPSQAAPFAPKVTSSERGSAPASASAAISCSLATTGSASAMTSGGRAAYGAVLSTTRAPRPAARRTAVQTTARGTSSCTRSTSPGPSASTAATSRSSSRSLAPGMTTIEFSPSSDTVTSACPVGRPAHDPHRRSTSMPRPLEPGHGRRCRRRRRRRTPTMATLAPGGGRGDRLVGALAAGELLEPVTEHGLPGPGVPLDPGHEVDVERPEHQHPPAHDASPRTVRTHRSAIRGPSTPSATSTMRGRQAVRVVREVARSSRGGRRRCGRASRCR